ncbi:MAG: hypothetical protein P8X64_03145 [Anaerolineales bacterium]|jgi:hypothetical protein
MDETIANPIVVALMFIGRCLVPLGIMLLISHYLRKWGLIMENNSEDDQVEETEVEEIS